MIRLGIRRKLALAFGLLMALVLVVAASGILGLRDVNGSYRLAIDRGLQLERLAGEMHVELLEARREEQQFLLRVGAEGLTSAQEKYVKGNHAHLARLLDAMRRLDAVVSGLDGPGASRIGDDLVALRPYIRVYGEDFDRIVDAIRSGAHADEVNRQLADLASSVIVVEPLVADIASEGRHHASDAIAQAQSAGRRTVIYVAAGTAAALLAGLALATLLGSQISRPLRGLAATAERFGAGDLGARAVVSTRDEIGTLAGLFNTMADQVGSSLEELRRSEENYRGIYENSPIGIYRGSIAGRPLSVNPALAHMLGFDSPAELIESLSGGIQQVYVQPSERESLIAEMSPDNTVNGREVEIYRRDYERIWVSITARLARDAEGEPLYTEAFVADITAQRRASAERQARKVAEAANLAKSRFLASMSHELRTPLNAIMGFAQILQFDKGRPAGELKQLQLIYTGGQHLLELIDDVLDLAKVEAGKFELDPQEVELDDFLRTVAEVCRVRAQAKGLALRVELAPDLPRHARLDPRRLRQVLLNMLGNAIKFTERGAVTLQVRELPPSGGPAPRLRFAVADTGPGIPADRLETIFQPFEQAGDLAQRAAGTGLGLSISRQLVRAMGGEIRVSSEFGVGSEFCFDIHVPCVAASIPAPAASDCGLPASHDGARRRALVIDDVCENRALLAVLLARAGFDVAEAGDGQAGIDAAAAHPPDLILVDTRMPVMDGIQAIRLLRARPATHHTPILVVSASAFQEDVERAMAAGANGFVAKPVDFRELLALISGLFSMDGSAPGR